MTMNRRSLIGGGLGAVALAGTRSALWAQSREPIKIGAFGPMSGNAAAQGQSIRESVEMVANLKNSAGGVLGRQIEIVIGDDAGKPEEAAVVARRFATRDQVSLAIGSVSSPASLAAAQVFREEELPQIVVSGTAQRITTQGNEWVFRSAVSDRKLVGDMVDFINEKMPNLKRFGFLYVNDDFGKGGFDAFNEAGKKVGMSITAEERYSRGDLDFIGQLTRIRSTNPDAIVEWSRYTEGALIHRQIKQMGWELPRFGSDGIAAPAFLDLAKEAANGVIYPTQSGDVREPPGRASFHRVGAQDLQQAPGLRSRPGVRRHQYCAGGDRAGQERRPHRGAQRVAPDRSSERARALQVRSERRSDPGDPHGADCRHQRDRRAQLTGGQRDDHDGQIGRPAPARQL
jgi:branched-chain amino acid transport system substrate-binding protein